MTAQNGTSGSTPQRIGTHGAVHSVQTRQFNQRPQASQTRRIMMAERTQIFTTEEIRTIIKFQTLLGKSSNDILKDLVAVVGAENAPGLSTIQRWAVKFRGGSTSVSDAPRSGRPSTSTHEEMVNEVERLVAEDRRIKVNEISYELEISVGSVHEILTKKLKLEKKSARWVPHVLSEEQKTSRLVTCRNHLRRYQIEGEQFLNRVITGHETWARSYEPELKRQSAEWLPVDSPRPFKAIRGMAKLKSMHIVFYSSRKGLVNYTVP